jgi:hypothetical protein
MSLLFSPTNWANPGAIGSTTPSTGVFSTLQLTSGGPIISQSSSVFQLRNAANTAFASVDGSLFRANNGAHNITLSSTGTNGTVTSSTGSLQLATAGTTVLNLSSTAASIFLTTVSTNTTTGALIVSGGAGIAGALNVGGAVSATSFIHNGSSYFRQQAQPTSPTTGTRWDELTAGGLLVNQWEWDGTDWIEIVIRHQSCPERAPTSTASFTELFFPAGRVLIRRVAYGLSVNTTYTSTDYWQVNLRTRVPGDPTDYSSTLVTINTAVTSSNQLVVTPNQKTVAGDTQIHSSYTRFGSAVALVTRASFQYSFIR